MIFPLDFLIFGLDLIVRLRELVDDSFRGIMWYMICFLPGFYDLDKILFQYVTFVSFKLSDTCICMFLSLNFVWALRAKFRRQLT